MKIHSIIQEPFPGSDEKGYYKNVYVDILGIIYKTPFNMPRDGLWYFDGQIFYLKPSK